MSSGNGNSRRSHRAKDDAHTVHEKRTGSKGVRSGVLRALCALAVLAVVCAGLAFHTGVGTPSSWGIADIAVLCPLGALETMLAAHTMVPRIAIVCLVALVAIVLLGRFFCAWICPVPLLRRIFGIKTSDGRRARRMSKRTARQGAAAAQKGDAHQQDEAEQNAAKPEDAAGSGRPEGTRYWVLGGTLVSSAIFGFPVFCLVCPVGLSFATVIALWRLFQFNETTLSLVVFPAILLVELLVARRWCHRFCPLGALLSLVSRLNRTFRPQVDPQTCLHMNGESCHRCAKVCPERIDLHDAAASVPLAECTKCRLCADECPSRSIRFFGFDGKMFSRKPPRDSRNDEASKTRIGT